MQMTLDQIGIYHSTDKSSMGHGYLNFYQLLFRDLGALRLLEIGVQFGKSLATWEQFYPDATIIGIDSVNNGLNYDENDRIELIIGNAYHPEMMSCLAAHKFNVIIDDGSHDPVDQEFFCKNYSHLLEDGGILIVEDVPNSGTIQTLAAALPYGFLWLPYDLRQFNGMHDSLLFVAWKI